MKITSPIALFLIFLTLKLTNQIDWSWWWVAAPLWLPLAVIFPIAFGWEIYKAHFESPEKRAARLLRKYARSLDQ